MSDPIEIQLPYGQLKLKRIGCAVRGCDDHVDFNRVIDVLDVEGGDTGRRHLIRVCPQHYACDVTILIDSVPGLEDIDPSRIVYCDERTIDDHTATQDGQR